jgi:hypothetical protein
MKFLTKMVSILALAAASTSAMAATYPSFGFVQEMAGVTGNGDISADFFNSTAYPDHIRIGAFKGEILIDPTTTTGMGYKYPVNSNIAIYGKLYLNSGGGTSITNITLGGSYTGSSGSFLYNGNMEAYSTAAGTSFNLKGAGFYQLASNKLGGKMSIGGEIDLQLSPSPTTTSIFAGLRWQPKQKLLVDAGLVSQVPAFPSGTTTTIATPAFVRLTLGL